MNKRRIAVITAGRSDYSIYMPVLAEFARRQLEYGLIVTGSHLSEEQGNTVSRIEKDGQPIFGRAPAELKSDQPSDIARAMGHITSQIGDLLHRLMPDMLLVLGDRFEMHAAVSAASPFSMPVAHIHGGEITVGAIDDRFRHSLTKLSHLHFVSTEKASRRVQQMGEEAWRITVSGAPALDSLRGNQLLDRADFFRAIGWSSPQDFILVTYHPVTLEPGQEEGQIRQLLAALKEVKRPVLFTLANMDVGGRTINSEIRRFLSEYSNATLIPSLGPDLYFSAMRHASMMVGNSSSGIIEAASFGLPVVNIGNRQLGREHGPNVINCGYLRDEILQAMDSALSPDFRASMSGMKNLYGDGNAAQRIVDRLAGVAIDSKLLLKRFVDMDCTT